MLHAVFCHSNQIVTPNIRSLRSGDRVIYTLEEKSDGKKHAINVRFIEGGDRRSALDTRARLDDAPSRVSPRIFVPSLSSACPYDHRRPQTIS